MVIFQFLVWTESENNSPWGFAAIFFKSLLDMNQQHAINTEAV